MEHSWLDGPVQTAQKEWQEEHLWSSATVLFIQKPLGQVRMQTALWSAVYVAGLAGKGAIDCVLPVGTSSNAVGGTVGKVVVSVRGCIDPAGVTLDGGGTEAESAGRIAGNAGIVGALSVHSVGTVDQALIGKVVVEDARDVLALLTGGGSLVAEHAGGIAGLAGVVAEDLELAAYAICLAGIGIACPDVLADGASGRADGVADSEVVDGGRGVNRVGVVAAGLAFEESGPGADETADVAGYAGIVADLLVHADGTGLQTLVVFEEEVYSGGSVAAGEAVGGSSHAGVAVGIAWVATVSRNIAVLTIRTESGAGVQGAIGGGDAAGETAGITVGAGICKESIDELAVGTRLAACGCSHHLVIDLYGATIVVISADCEEAARAEEVEVGSDAGEAAGEAEGRGGDTGEAVGVAEHALKAGGVGVLAIRTGLVARVSPVDQVVVGGEAGDGAGVAVGESSAEAGEAPIGTVGALVVGKLAELVGGTGNGAGGAAQEVGNSIHVLARLASGVGCASCARRYTGSADISDTIREFATVAATEASGKTDLQIVAGTANCTGCVA
ncbi:uncharacterized protein LOC116268093 [Nymphaea colorata]|uniref:uncharacterized protein LOC116268093 n=1 Tax=Nymphaea colorata TaxID=210225 RepID=UPI00129E82D1|nr:uncharacterized protein LOC116268093 [Nymphaea colorata]